MLFKGNSSRLELLIGKIQAHKESPSPPRDDKCGTTIKDALGTSSSSWHSEDGGTNSRRGGETPSSCATPTSASFPSEPEVDAEIGGINVDGNNSAAPYPCQFCDRTFPRLSYLKKHEQSHGDQMPYRCNWCARLFKHKRSRDRHVKLHTGDRRYRCSHCEAAFSRSDHLKIHMKTHDNQKPYQCTSCSRGYNTAAALTSHMQSHKKHQTPGQNTKLEMDYGRRSVSSHSAASSPPIGNSPSPISLNLGHHRKNSLKSSYLVNGNGGTNAPPAHSPLKLACMYCTRDSFTSMQQLQMHVHAMHQAILRGEGLTVPSPPNDNRNENDNDIYVDANTAPSKIRDAVELNGSAKYSETGYRRIRDVAEPETTADPRSPENGLGCGQCTMKFSNVIALRDHAVTIHRNDGFVSSLMMCPLCGVPCASAASYAEHYLLRHCDNRQSTAKERSRNDWDNTTTSNPANDDDERRRSKIRGPEYVPTPDRRSMGSVDPSPADLSKNHDRPPDSGDSGYSAGTLLCGQCGAALKDFESFREHVARHLQADHLNLDNSPKNPCPKCDATFNEREDMLSHLTKHYLGHVTKEYACGVCKKFYPHPDVLQRHLLDTHAHHLYRCALCRDTFDSRVAIQVHFAVKHSQECRIFRCNGCPASNNENTSNEGLDKDGRPCFRSETEMANHVRTVHAPPENNTRVANDPTLPKSRGSTPGPVVNNGTAVRCVFCGACCNTDLELQLHMAGHSTGLYRCPICRESFPVEFLLDRHVAQAHRNNSETRNDGRDGNERSHRNPRLPDENPRPQKRGRSPATSSNNNSLNHRDNNNKRPNYGTTNGAATTRGPGQRCDLCDHGEFATEAELQAHKKLIHAPMKLQSKSLSSVSMTCAYCGEVCRSRTDLESHTRIQHASNEPGGRHKCNICDEVCPSGGILAEHKLQKHCKIRLSDVCVVCRATLTTESQFVEHVQRHSLETNGGDCARGTEVASSSVGHLPAGCVVCRQTLMSDFECRLHARHHLRRSTERQGATLSPIRKREQQQQQTARPSGQLSCCLCLREFDLDDFVGLPSNSNGTPTASPRVCKPCYVRHSQGLPILSSPYEHVGATSLTEATQRWRAVKDRGDWDRSADAYSHPDNNEGFFKNDGHPGIAKMAVKDGSDDGRCDECGVKFENSEEAENHRINGHKNNYGSANVYSCIQCQMSFPTEEKIQQHVRKEHLESSNKASIDALRCHLCLFEANSPLQLQGHLIEHTFAGCAGLTCYICHALFTTPIALQNHLLQLHGLGARPYDCDCCSLKFFFRIELDHHTVMVHHKNGKNSSPSRGAGPETTTEKLSATPNDEPIVNEIDEKIRCSDNVTIKEEIPNSPEDDNVVNVDGNVDSGSHSSDEIPIMDAKKEQFSVPCTAME